MSPVQTVDRSLKYCHLFRGHFSSHSFVRLPAPPGVRLFLLQIVFTNDDVTVNVWSAAGPFRFPAEGRQRGTRNVCFEAARFWGW